MNWGCDHDGPFHWRLIHEAASGALRRCPSCGAVPYRARGGVWDWGEPRESWKEAWRRANPTSPAPEPISNDWSRPRMVPWLPWDHPNFWVTSPKEAARVCREWGIDPDRGGFISEAHKDRAFAAARKNRRVAFGKFSARDQADIRAARAKNI